ncbi:DUF5134 domain-containing protein [Nocardia sp. NPDC019395]|uniref:DUF5134 domain-containing protein n=1 Tax=Nocardia sp. NPDC019395 TaxID=3154686 RepID=UPI0033DBCF1D
MAEFELDQAAVRMLFAVAFVVAAGVVLAGVTRRPVLAGGQHGAAGGCADSNGDDESAAAHLLMCAVMSVMVLFPARAHTPALHGVLLAMTLVFALLLAARIVGWNRPRNARQHIGALGYHLVASGVMLSTMSGHSAGHGGGASALPVTVLALAFLADSIVVTLTALRGRRLRWAGHPAVPGGRLPLAVLPHLIMDLGMAYMLFAVASS